MPDTDPLGTVLPGDPTPNSARMWNALTAAARQRQLTAAGEAAAGDSPDVFAEPAALALVRAGGAGLAPFAVSAFGAAVSDVTLAQTEARRRPVFEFKAPASAADAVAVTVEAAGPRGLARAAVAGVALCRLAVGDPAHRFAAAAPGVTTHLASADAGYPVLHRWGAAGTVWAFVLLDRGAGADPDAATRCRSMLVGKAADSALTGRVSGVGKCANVAAATIWMTYDETAGTGLYGGWVSTPFETRAGATAAAVFLDANANPAATLTVDATERPLTWLGCDSRGRLRFVGFDCLWCGPDGWAAPCGDNHVELLVSCGVLGCQGTIEMPPRLDYRFEMASGGPARFGTLTLGADPAAPAWFRAVAAAQSAIAIAEPDNFTGVYWTRWVDASNPFGTAAAFGYGILLIDKRPDQHDGCLEITFWIDSVSSGVTAAASVGVTAASPGEFVCHFSLLTFATFELTATTDAEPYDPCGDSPPPPPPPPPPVTDCSICADGAPRVYKVPITGGTGGYETLNGDWTFTDDGTGTCTWVIDVAGYTGTLQWVDLGGGNRRLDALIQDDTSGAFVSWSSDTFGAADSCCREGGVAGTTWVDWDVGTGGAGTRPDLPTAEAVGACN